VRAGKHRKHIKNQKTTLSVGFGGCKGFLFLLILDWKLVFLHPLALYLQEGVASREIWRMWSCAEPTDAAAFPLTPGPTPGPHMR